MFSRILIALAFAVVAFVAYLLLKAYKPSWFGFDTFESIQGAAPSIQFQPPVEPPRVVSPSECRDAPSSSPRGGSAGSSGRNGARPPGRSE